MREIKRDVSSMGCKRVYYEDNGTLVERLIVDSDDVDGIVEGNLDAQSSYSKFNKSGQTRVVAEIPPEVFVGWLMEEGVPGFCDAEALDCVINKKLRDPDNKYFLTVPSTYRMMRHG